MWITSALIALFMVVSGLLVFQDRSDNTVARLFVNSKGECRGKVGSNPNFHTEITKRTQGGRVTCSISFDKQGEEEQ